MSNPESYVREINSIDQELKRMNTKTKKLRNQKKAKEKLLYQYMVKNKLEVYQGIKISSIQPKIKRKTEKEKRAESIEMFRKAGIPNPEQFYEEYKKQMRAKKEEAKMGSTAQTTPKNKNGYDPFLGF